jgi:dTDP-4-dehydrorhamnose reductase
MRTAPRLGVELVALGRRDCDVLSPTRVAQVFVDIEPDVIINCAAWTAVDTAEDFHHESWRVNAVGPAVVADAAVRSLESALVIQMSTDYVFSGHQAHGQPLAEGTPTDPLSTYGRSKLAGENAVRAIAQNRSLVVRTSWLYGRADDDFVGRVRRLALSGSAAEVVDDQWGSPTLVDDLADSLCQLAISVPRVAELSGILHLANSGFTSRYGLAQEIYRLSGMDPGLVKTKSSPVGDTYAKRPGWSALTSCRLDELGVQPLRSWQEALAEALEP